MKFKAELSGDGVEWLKIKLAPVLERLGKEVTLLLTTAAVTVVQDQDSTGSIRVHSTFSPGLLFGDYRLESQNDNKIGVRMLSAPLVRVLRSIEDEFVTVHMKLVKRKLSAADNRQHPFLNFTITTHTHTIVQDVPLLSKPMSPVELKEVEAHLPARDHASTAPLYYLDIQPLVVSQLPVVVDRIRHVNETVQLALTQTGELHLQADSSTVDLGAEYEGVRVLPAEHAKARTPGREESPSVRLQRQLARGEATQVSVRAKDLSKSLLCHVTQPDRLLCGVSRMKGFVQLALQYAKRGTDTIDPGVVIHIKLPVMVED